MGITRRTKLLIFRSLYLFARTLPQNFGLVILGLLMLNVIFDFIWPYVLPLNRNAKFDLVWAFSLACLPASHWLTSVYFLFSEAEKGNPPSFYEAVKFGLSRAYRSYCIIVASLFVVFVFLSFLSFLATRSGDTALAVGILVGIVGWCWSVMTIPVFASSFILTDGEALITKEIDTKRPIRLHLLIASTIFFGIGFGIINGLWRQTELNFFHVTYLLFVTTLSLPLASQVVVFEETRVKQSACNQATSGRSPSSKYSRRGVLAVGFSVAVIVFSLVGQNYRQRQEWNEKLIVTSAKFRPGDDKVEVGRAITDYRIEASMKSAEGNETWLLRGPVLLGARNAVVELNFDGAGKLLHRKVYTADSVKTELPNAPPDF